MERKPIPQSDLGPGPYESLCALVCLFVKTQKSAPQGVAEIRLDNSGKAQKDTLSIF